MSAAMAYCTYCRSNQPAAGFRDVFTPTGRKNNSKCLKCARAKYLSIAERDRRGALMRDDRKRAQAERLAEMTRRRSEKIKADSQ